MNPMHLDTPSQLVIELHAIKARKRLIGTHIPCNLGRDISDVCEKMGLDILFVIAENEMTKMERNKKIYKARQQGLSYQQIAPLVELTHEQCRNAYSEYSKYIREKEKYDGYREDNAEHKARVNGVKLSPICKKRMPAAEPDNYEGPEQKYSWGNSFNRDWLNKVA